MVKRISPPVSLYFYIFLICKLLKSTTEIGGDLNSIFRKLFPRKDLIFFSLFPAFVLHNTMTMPMKKLIFIYLVAVAVFSISCNVTVNQIFGKKTPHEKYGVNVESTPLGHQWLAVSKAVLNKPLTIKLPYRHLGYFQIDKPRALALEFKATQGERINFDLTKKTGTDFVIYADLFKQNGSGISHQQAADTAFNSFSIDISETGSYVLRLQPELYRTGEYSLAVSVSSITWFPGYRHQGKSAELLG